MITLYLYAVQFDGLCEGIHRAKRRAERKADSDWRSVLNIVVVLMKSLGNIQLFHFQLISKGFQLKLQSIYFVLILRVSPLTN